MKKLIASIFAVCALAFSANAQFYASGSLGMNISAYEGNSGVTCHLDPGVGYRISEDSSAGLFLSLGANSGFEWNLNPYFRYAFANVSDFHFFAEARLSFGQLRKSFSWGAGVFPGVSYSISDNIDLVSHLACIGVQGYEKTAVFRLGIVDAATFGIQFKF